LIPNKKKEKAKVQKKKIFDRQTYNGPNEKQRGRGVNPERQEAAHAAMR